MDINNWKTCTYNNHHWNKCTQVPWSIDSQPITLIYMYYVHKTFPIGIKLQEKCEILNGDMDILKSKVHLHILHTSIFSRKVYCQTLVMNWNPLRQYSADNAWLNFHFLSPSLTKTIPWKSQVRARVCVRMCLSERL